MMDDFLVQQKIAYKILKNSIVNDRCSHAYLINTNGYNKGFDLARAFAKYILCPSNKTNGSDCGCCNQCHLIDEEMYPDLKIIMSDGLWIKKEQTDQLQSEFSKKSFTNGKMVYIINGVENLNIAASNSILKFLEEPEDNIIAILITDNIYNVLNTIVSRCQVINLNNSNICSDNMLYNVANQLYNNSAAINEFVNDPNSLKKIEKVVDFLVFLDNNRCDSIIYINSLWSDFFISKDDYLFAFNIMAMFYSDVINLKMGRRLLLENFSSIISNFQKYDYSVINARLNLILDLKNDLFSNVNLDLLMDKFIIKMEEI